MDEVRHAVGIVRVVEEHVSLKRAGRTLKGLCPFHSERTPSFHVDEAKGFYYCFGCGAGGDVFKFLMQHDAVTFPEAVRQLADKAGLRVPERRAEDPGDALRERVLAINAAAQVAFAQQLAGGGRSSEAKEALQYLADRGIGPDVVEQFGLGWAPDSWDFLVRELSGRFEMRELTAAGLVVPRDSGPGGYDRFRRRVTFPIRAVSERILGFGGRIVGDGEPKYLNSPETPVYTKGRHLFALDRAKAAIRRSGTAVLVEGYIDAISLHAQGVGNAVAVLGTALTAEQARLLARFARRVVLNFDGDAAGERATRRSVEALLGAGLEVRVLELPAGSDPDDQVRRLGGAAYARAVESAAGFLDVLLKTLAREHDLAAPSGRRDAASELLPYLVAVADRVLRAELTDAACHGLGIKHGVLNEEVRASVQRGLRQLEPSRSEPELESSHAEKALLVWMLSDGRAREAFRERVGDLALATLPNADIYAAILAEPDGRLNVASVVERLPHDWQRKLVSRCAVDQHHEPIGPGDLREKVHAALDELGLSAAHAARRRKAEVDRELAEAHRRNDLIAAKQLMAEASALGRAMHQ